uniref:Secreted protein n=1 Tax=Panstrongylus lignarius TaxID=156445 RepID=A0A224Y5Q5_9HEMI
MHLRFIFFSAPVCLCLTDLLDGAARERRILDIDTERTGSRHWLCVVGCGCHNFFWCKTGIIVIIIIIILSPKPPE